MIKLAARTQGGWHRFTVSFSTEAQAIAYAEARRSTHIIEELEDAPLDQIREAALITYLYPTCHHGMSLSLCGDPYGPHHFGTYADERSRAGY